MDVLRAFFQFGKDANSRASGFVEGVVHFQQQCMVTLDNQRVVCVYISLGETHGAVAGVYQKRIWEGVLARVSMPPSLGTKLLTLTLSQRGRG